MSLLAIAALRCSKLILLDLSAGKQTSSDLQTGSGRISLSPDGKQMLDSGWDTRVWDITSGKIEDSMSLPGYPATEALFSPDGRYVAQAFENNTIQLHDAETGHVLHTFRGHAGGVKAIDFSPDGSLLASGGVDGTVRLWHVEHRRSLVTLSGHDQPISSVEFSPDGLIIASISNDGEVYKE